MNAIVEFMGQFMNLNDLLAAAQLMVQGMFGIFAVMAIIAGVVYGFTKLSK